MKDYINIIEEITDREYENSFILTFNCSLFFYENLVLKGLWEKNCSNNVILMDRKQYSVLINDERDKVHYCGSYYLCEGIETRGAFHPKIILLTGKNFGKLLIGSGNTTFFGYGRNFELFYKFEYNDSCRDYLFLFQEVVNYIDQLYEKLQITPNPALALRIKLLKETSWLNQETHWTKEKFIHNLDRPILDQILEIAPRNIQKIILAAPYYGEKLETIQRFQKEYPASNIIVLTQSGNTNFPIDYFLSNQKLFPHVSLHKISQPITSSRLFHGKFIYLTNGKSETFFSGSPNITKAALESRVIEGNAEVGILLNQNSKNQFASLWNEFLDKKKISERNELLVNVRTGEIPSVSELYSIKILEAYLDGPLLYLSYKSELTGPAEVLLNGTHVLKIKLAKNGKIVESITAYLNQSKSDNCLFVQIKSKDSQSNLLWVSNTLVRRNTEKTYLNKQVNSLTSYIKDLSFINWLIELSPNLQVREYAAQNIIKGVDLVNQEEAGEENELPKDLFFVEEKSDYCTFLQKTSNPRIYTYNNDMLNEVLSGLLHVFGKMVTSASSASSSQVVTEKEEKTHRAAEYKEEEIMDVFAIHDKIFAKIDRLVSKTIANLNRPSALDISATLNLCDFLVFLIWSFSGIKIAVNGEEDKVFIGARQYLEASAAVLERLWVRTAVDDYLESKKEETDYSYLGMTKTYALCLCLVAFNMWVLLNREEFIEDLKKHEDALIEIFSAIIEKIKRLPATVVKDVLAKEKVRKIAEKLSTFDGFNIGDIDLIRLSRLKMDRAQLEKMIDIVNAERLPHLLDKKKRERKKFEEELTKAMIRFGKQQQLLQTDPGKHILDYGMAEEDILKIKKKIEENERTLALLSDTKKVPKVKIRLPREILRFFHLDTEGV